LRIGVDLDGVVYDFVRSWELWNGLPVIPPSSWEFYADDHGYTLEEYLKSFALGVDHGYIFRYGAPKPGSVEALTQLREAGHTIHIVTDRFVGSGSMAQINTALWLDENPEVVYDSLTFSKDKTLVNTDYFIDDRPKNVDALRNSYVFAYLLDEGRSDQAGHPYWIPNWDAFIEKVEAREG
jgi:5'(3')-deoxyribonucleotidase